MVRTNYWLFTLIAAIMGFVSTILPAWTGIEDSSFINAWYFGFYVSSSSSGFINEEGFEMPGIIAIILLVVGSTLVLFSALSAKRKGENKSLFALIGGIFNIIAPTIFMIGMTFVYSEFWLVYFGTFGLIFPFIGGILAIICWFSLKRA